MSQQSEQPAQSPKDSKESKGGWISKIPKAFEKAIGAKDKGFFERVKIFFGTLFEEMQGVEKEEKAVSEETKKAVQKGAEDTLKDAKSAVGLKEGLEQSDKDFYDEVLAMAVASNEELDDTHQAAVHTALGKLDKAIKGEASEVLTLDEASAAASIGFMTLTKLRAKFPDKAKFKEALDRLDRVSDSSNYPIKKLMSAPVLKIFEIDFNVTAEGLQAAGALIGVSEKGEGLKFLEKFGIGATDATKVSTALSNLKTNPIKDEATTVDVMRQYFFPNTSRENVQTVAQKFNQLIVGGTDKVNSDILTDLAFCVEDADMKRLVTILGGERSVELAKAA